jgi:tetratricopeptide (TPR) repeat protein
MASMLPDYEYDIFISYRQKDNKYDGWVTEFVENLRKELEATFKDEVNIYFDINPHDGILETYNVESSLRKKLKCLLFIPVISQTYCDTRSFAWQNEFVAFNRLASEDVHGRDIRLNNGNIASRILPVKIHEIEEDDRLLLEKELGTAFRSINFIYREAGVNRPLKPSDNKNDNQNKTDYRNQINKVANAAKEIIDSIRRPSVSYTKPEGAIIPDREWKAGGFIKISARAKMTIAIFSVIILAISAFSVLRHNRSDKYYGREYSKNITSSTKAYEWFMKAVYIHTRENKADLDSSIYFLTKAIEADSSFALAHARLSIAYVQQSFWNEPNKGYQEKAFLEAGKALYFDPDLAEGLMAKAYCKWNFQNRFPHEIVIREFRKSLEIDPGAYEVYHLLGLVYLHVGLMKESFESYSKAVKLNPDDWIISTDFISWYNFTGKQEDLEHLIDLYKQTPVRHISSLRRSFWALALLKLGHQGEAETMLNTALKKDSSDINLISAYAILLAKKGDKNGALEKIALCEKADTSLGHYHHVAMNLGETYALLGDYQKSVDKLTWAADNGLPNYQYFRDDPYLKSLHQFPPYIELLDKLKALNEKYRRIANE